MLRIPGTSGIEWISSPVFEAFASEPDIGVIATTLEGKTVYQNNAAHDMIRRHNIAAEVKRAVGRQHVVSFMVHRRDFLVEGSVHLIEDGALIIMRKRRTFRDDTEMAEYTEGGIPFTPREREVARLIGRGMSNKEIAAELHISLHTAEWFAKSIGEKMDTRSRAAAAVKARQIEGMPWITIEGLT